MKRVIKPLKYLLLFKGCFIACVVAVVAMAYSVCWGVSWAGQQAEYGKQAIYTKAQEVVVAVGSRLGVIHTEEEQQAAIEQQVLSILKDDEQKKLGDSVFEELEASLAPVPVKKPKTIKKSKPVSSNSIARYSEVGDARYGKKDLAAMDRAVAGAY